MGVSYISQASGGGRQLFIAMHTHTSPSGDAAGGSTGEWVSR